MPVPGSKLLANALSKAAWRKRILSGALSVSVATTPAAAMAKNVTAGSAKMAEAIQMTAKQSKFLGAIDDVVALTDKNLIVRGRARNLLFRTGMHESAGLKYTKQIGGGPARGYFQIEYDTAKDIVQRYAARPDKKAYMGILEKFSGKTREELLALNKAQLNSLVEENVRFSATVARLKYKMAPAAIPEGLEAQAKYWGKYYQTTANAKKQTQFMMNNRQYEHIIKNKNTAGLVKSLDKNKVNHQIQNVKKKTDHLFNK